MNKSFHLFALFFMISALFLNSSCISSKKFMGFNEIKITDSGELYSTYSFSEDDIAELSKKLSSTKIEEIKKYSNEENWPSGISTLDARDKVRLYFTDYKTYNVAYFNNKYLLIVPVEKNKHMKEEMQSSHDIYFVIGESGVSK